MARRIKPHAAPTGGGWIVPLKFTNAKNVQQLGKLVGLAPADDKAHTALASAVSRAIAEYRAARGHLDNSARPAHLRAGLKRLHQAVTATVQAIDASDEATRDYLSDPVVWPAQQQATLPGADLMAVERTLSQLENALWVRLQLQQRQGSRGAGAKRSRVFLVARLNQIFDAHRLKRPGHGRDRVKFIRDACAMWRVPDVPKRDDALLALLDPPA
jgi:hypothetical protein